MSDKDIETYLKNFYQGNIDACAYLRDKARREGDHKTADEAEVLYYAYLSAKAGYDGDHQAEAAFAAKAEAAAGAARQRLLARASEARSSEALAMKAARAASKAARLARKAMPSNGMIKASRVLSLANAVIPCVFWMYPIPALLGVIFGFAGHRQLKRTQTVTAQKDGIKIGIVCMAVSAAFWVVILLATIFLVEDSG